jgi:hypothetical protein
MNNRNIKGEYESTKVPTFIKYMFALSTLCLIVAYTMNASNDVTLDMSTMEKLTPTVAQAKVDTFEANIKQQVETSQKFVKALKENHETTQKAEVLRARAEQAYKEATEQYNATVKVENELLESVALTNPVALKLYYNAGNDLGLFATSTVQ